MATRLPLAARAPLTATMLGAALALAACGGGGGDADTTPGPGVAPPDGEVMPPPTEIDTTARPPDMMPPDEMMPDAMTPDDEGDCSVLAQNEWVYGNMLDYYLFYDQVPVVDPADFDSPETLLRTVRFEERDPFSFIAPAGESDLESVEGREFGLGYNWGEEFDGSVRITRVVLDSPFGRAGIERGDIIVEIDGRPALEALRDRERFDAEILGTPEAPGESTWTFAPRGGGETFTERFVATEYNIDTVRHVATYVNPAYDGVMGYFLFTRFLGTSADEIDAAFDRFREEGVTGLVLDLRYNRGGRISVAERLASLIADPGMAGATLQRYVHNDKYQSENFELRIRDDIAGLGLRTLVVLVTGASASSSEIVIGGLEPLMDVRVIGTGRTSGKPYVQRGRDRCDQRLNAIEAEAVNADGNSVFGGIAPDCRAEDDWRQGFGQDETTGEFENMLIAGLDLLVFDTCEPFVEARARGGNGDERRESASGQGATAIGGALLD